MRHATPRGLRAPFLGIVASATLASATLACAAPAQGARQAEFTGTVRVAEDGTLRVESVEGVNGAIADAVRSQLQARRAVPAVRDGRAVATTSPVTGTVVLTADGEDFTLALRYTALHPGAIRRTPIVYPADALRAGRPGWAEVEFTLDASGTPQDVRLVQVSDPLFAKAVTRPLGTWRFADPGDAAGRRYRLTVAFQAGAKKPEPAFECPTDPTYARFEDQSGCMDALTVVGTFL